MKFFGYRDIEEAIDHSLFGGQALHLHRVIANRRKAPACFKAAVARGEQIAHLFDRNTERLEKTARELGVRVVVVERAGTPRQHVDLCGRPLAKALSLCGRDVRAEFPAETEAPGA